MLIFVLITGSVSESLDLTSGSLSMSSGDSMSASAIHDGDNIVGGSMALFTGGGTVLLPSGPLVR